MNDPVTIRRLYGRRQGHKLREGQAALVEETLPQLSVPEAGPLDARALFGDDRPLHVEIGFGAGEHLAAQATANPGAGFIGCEPFLNGVVGALGHIRDGGLDNVRLHMGDALEAALPKLVRLTPKGIREHLKLNAPIYSKTAAYGHFGRDPEGDLFTWEKTDLVDALKAAIA